MNITKQAVLDALQNKEPSQIPVSFWHHFAKSEFTNALQEPKVLEVNEKGFETYNRTVNPDFLKMMTDGYFDYPFLGVKDPKKLADLKQIQPLPKDHPWFQGQKNLARKQSQVDPNKLTFYTIFSPLLSFKWALIEHYKEPLTLADKRFTELYLKDPDTIQKVLTTMAMDYQYLAQLVLETDVAGIYYSTQSIQDERLNNLDFFQNVHQAADLKVIQAINQSSQLNILHICGFDGAKNNLEWFTDYPLQVINWSIHSDGYSLAEGKKLFNDRPVLGGFGITTKDVLYAGTKAQIQAEVTHILADAPRKGLLIGADCTIPRDTPVEHIRWAIEAVHQA